MSHLAVGLSGDEDRQDQKGGPWQGSILNLGLWAFMISRSWRLLPAMPRSCIANQLSLLDQNEILQF